MNSYFVYILGSKSGVLYIGVTSNIVKRVFEHKEKYVKGFSQKYNVNRLLYFEETSNVTSAIEREKQLKKWKREWKENLINQKNPDRIFNLVLLFIFQETPFFFYLTRKKNRGDRY